jgi:hypothetical protein
VAGIARRAVIKLAAEIDDLHAKVSSAREPRRLF